MVLLTLVVNSAAMICLGDEEHPAQAAPLPLSALYGEVPRKYTDAEDVVGAVAASVYSHGPTALVLLTAQPEGPLFCCLLRALVPSADAGTLMLAWTSPSWTTAIWPELSAVRLSRRGADDIAVTALIGSGQSIRIFRPVGRGYGLEKVLEEQADSFAFRDTDRDGKYDLIADYSVWEGSTGKRPRALAGHVMMQKVFRHSGAANRFTVTAVRPDTQAERAMSLLDVLLTPGACELLNIERRRTKRLEPDLVYDDYVFRPTGVLSEKVPTSLRGGHKLLARVSTSGGETAPIFLGIAEE